jgi:hypothetical protein
MKQTNAVEIIIEEIIAATTTKIIEIIIEEIIAATIATRIIEVTREITEIAIPGEITTIIKTIATRGVAAMIVEMTIVAIDQRTTMMALKIIGIKIAELIAENIISREDKEEILTLGTIIAMLEILAIINKKPPIPKIRNPNRELPGKP